MITLDAINGSFELIGAIIQFINVRQIIKDKAVKGVHWLPVLFFSTWGYFNLIYYPNLNQWFSFGGSIMMTLATTMWVILLIKYRR